MRRPTVAPSNVTSPASGSISRTRSRAVVDLPQPDSPTMPSVSPSCTSNDTRSTAWTTPRLLRRGSRPLSGKCLVRSRTVEEQAAHSLTSIAWRSPSLIRLKHIDVTKIITPGSAAMTGFTHRAYRRLFSMRPHSGFGRRDAEAEEGEPRGQDDADADQARRVDQDRAQDVVHHVVAQRRRAPSRRSPAPPPRSRAPAPGWSRSPRCARSAGRTSRVSARMVLPSPAPRMPQMAMARRMDGKAYSTSIDAHDQRC